MAGGFESKETEGRERENASVLCEGYACSEVATLRINGKNVCVAHRQAVPSPPVRRSEIEHSSP